MPRATLKGALFRALCAPVVHRPLRALLAVLPAPWRRAASNRLPYPGRLAVDVSGAGRVVLVHDGSDWIASRLGWSGADAFEPETRRALLAELGKARVFFDVGANTGWYSLVAALAKPGLEVHAFEPLPQAAAMLRANLAANRLERVHVVEAAVGAENGEAELYVPGGTSLPVSASLRRDFRPGSPALRVRRVTLDSYARERGVARVDVIKIDAEGYEVEVLEGARELLGSSRPTILCEVLPGFGEERLQEMLGGLGYRFFHLRAEGPVEVDAVRGDAGYRAMNYLFKPS